MCHLPLALTVLRLLLGLAIVAIALVRPSPAAFAVCLTGGLLSDIFDGRIARRLGVATTALRRLDSVVDTAFYACAVAAVLVTTPGLLRPYVAPLIALLVLEVARYVYDLRKFGREASYHLWSAKAWGLLLFAGMSSLLVFRANGWPVALAIYWGIASDVEGLAISMTLREWRADVPSIWHARRIARGESRSRP